MQSLIYLMCIPILLLAVVWLVKPVQQMTAIAAILGWLQASVVVWILWPALTLHGLRLHPTQDLSIDHIGALFAVLTQLVVATSISHAHIFFANDKPTSADSDNHVRIFYSCATLFSVAATSVFFCNNLGLLWIAVEGTTLCTAPLVFFHRNKHAVEAAWKYLIICSVGIAFALFGTMFIFASSQSVGTPDGSLNLEYLIEHAQHLQYPLLRLGFLFCLLGYGTKAGVFPLHGWLPDAYSEAPAPASAMLSGGLLNCTLFAIWRISEVVSASGHQDLVHNAAVDAGVLTVLMASIFLIRQHGIKRLFAYSSIENAGLMLTAIGLGSGPLFFLLALNHSAAKVALFLISGNIIQTTGTKSLNDIHGILTINPYWAALLALASFAVTGAPPFGSFAAEWQLLSNASHSHLWIMMAVLLFSLALAFLAVCMHVGKIICGKPSAQALTLPPVLSSLMPAGLVMIALLCGITAFPKLLW